MAGFVLCGDRRPEPILFGATGTHSDSVGMPPEAPSRYEPGSQNVWAAAGLQAAPDWLAAEGRERVAGQAAAAARAIAVALHALPGVRVLAPAEDAPAASILAFSVAGQAPRAVEEALAAEGIAVRAGLHCAPWAHRW